MWGCPIQFYQWKKKEAERVLKQNGIITVWTYNLVIISPEIDSAIK